MLGAEEQRAKRSRDQRPKPAPQDLVGQAVGASGQLPSEVRAAVPRPAGVGDRDGRLT